jgi:hypothetical protein
VVLDPRSRRQRQVFFQRVPVPGHGDVAAPLALFQDGQVGVSLASVLFTALQPRCRAPVAVPPSSAAQFHHQGLQFGGHAPAFFGPRSR